MIVNFNPVSHDDVSLDESSQNVTWRVTCLDGDHVTCSRTMGKGGV